MSSPQNIKNNIYSKNLSDSLEDSIDKDKN